MEMPSVIVDKEPLRSESKPCPACAILPDTDKSCSSDWAGPREHGEKRKPRDPKTLSLAHQNYSQRYIMPVSFDDLSQNYISQARRRLVSCSDSLCVLAWSACPQASVSACLVGPAAFCASSY